MSGPGDIIQLPLLTPPLAALNQVLLTRLNTVGCTAISAGITQLILGLRKLKKNPRLLLQQALAQKVLTLLGQLNHHHVANRDVEMHVVVDQLIKPFLNRIETALHPRHVLKCLLFDLLALIDDALYEFLPHA